LVTGVVHGAVGGRTAIRSEITPRTGGGYDESLEISTGSDDTWSPPLATTYLPFGDPAAPSPATAAPAAPAAPAPVAATPVAAAPPPTPSAPPASLPPVAVAPPPVASPATAEPPPGVTVRSDRLPGDRRVENVAMASPMTLDFTLGPLDRLPPQTGWTTTELAPYVAAEVHVPQVVVSRRQRRQTVAIELTVHLQTTAFQRKVDIEAILLSDGAPVAEARGEAIAIGKLIASHDPKTGRPVTLSLALDSATFEALFADDRRPTIRLTVAVR
jgi:hypothetical protein